MKTHLTKLTIQAIKARKNTDKLVCLTAYSARMAHLIAPYTDIILVGDSLGSVVYGLPTTQDVTIDMMIQHAKAVRRGAPHSFIVVDFPYSTYDSPGDALNNARRIMDDTECDAVKLEGGINKAHVIKALNDSGIPIMAHIGLLPQSFGAEDTYRITGKTDAEADALINDALAVQNAGAFAVVLEGVIETVAYKMTEKISIPTIGIGASPACDGQILVTDDMIGLTGDNVPKFVEQFGDVDHTIQSATKTYANAVRNGAFPSREHVYMGKN